jgi:hypothetical protein
MSHIYVKAQDLKDMQLVKSFDLELEQWTDEHDEPAQMTHHIVYIKSIDQAIKYELDTSTGYMQLPELPQLVFTLEKAEVPFHRFGE